MEVHRPHSDLKAPSPLTLLSLFLMLILYPVSLLVFVKAFTLDLLNQEESVFHAAMLEDMKGKGQLSMAATDDFFKALIAKAADASLSKSYSESYSDKKLYENKFMRLLVHMLWWRRDSVPELDLSFLERYRLTTDIIRNLFDVFNGVKWVETGDFLGKDLKMLALANGDFFLENLRLGDKEGKACIQHVKIMKIEGAESKDAFEVFINLLDRASESGKFDDLTQELRQLRWQIRFAFWVNSKWSSQTVIRLLIQNLPPDFELVFPLSPKEHAQLISFSRSGWNTYGFKVYNSGSGIGSYHLKVELSTGQTKYSPFLAFKDVSWEMLDKSFLLRNLLSTTLTVDQIYSGCLGVFTLNGKQWLYEDYLAHAQRLDGLENTEPNISMLPRLIVDQRSGTCVVGSIKAFLISNMNAKFYRRLNKFIKIDHSLVTIKEKADRWLNLFRGKEDVRYTLRSILQNVARRIPKESWTDEEKTLVLANLKECLKIVEGFTRHSPSPKYELQIWKEGLKVDDSGSGRTSNKEFVFPNIRGELKTLDQMVSFLKELDELSTFYRSSEPMGKVIIVRTIGELPLLTSSTLGTEDPRGKRRKIIQMLHLMVSTFSYGYNWNFSELSEASFAWEFLHFRMVVHHYAALSEEYYFLAAGKGTPSVTLADCSPFISNSLQDSITMDFKMRLKSKNYSSKERIYTELNGETLETPYLEAMNSWHKDVVAKDIFKLPGMPYEVEKCIYYHDCDVATVAENFPSFQIEFFFTFCLEYFRSTFIMLPPYRIPNEGYYRFKNAAYHQNPRTNTILSINDNTLHQADGLSVYPLKFISCLQFQGYLATHNMTYEHLYLLLTTTTMFPIGSSEIPDGVTYAQIGLFEGYSGNESCIRNSLALSISFKSFRENIMRSIEDMLKYLIEKPMPNIYELVQYYTVVLHFEIQHTVKVVDKSEGIETLIDSLIKTRESVEIAIDRKLLATTTNSLGSIDMLLLACQSSPHRPPYSPL